MALYRMENPVQSYAWGSRAMLAAIRAAEQPLEFHGNEVTEPEAEMWMGSHPRGPSTVLGDDGERTALPDHLAADPEKSLGAEAAALRPPGEETPGLPFLFKILTAERGLSIQSHPTRERAAEGFGREEGDGIDIAAPNRNYRDRNHKPELMCALSDFWGLRGFRPYHELVDEMAALATALTGPLPDVADALRRFAVAAAPETWREAFSMLVPPERDSRRRAMLADSVARYAASRGTGGSGADRDSRYWWCLELLRQFPGDPGAAAPLYLNLVHLHPGDAMYLDAGILHAYLYGAGVEIMANSDNVLRAGCTAKHVDVPELLATLSFDGESVVPLVPEAVEAGGVRVQRYATDAREFELTAIAAPTEAGTAEIQKRSGPAVLLAVGGTARAACPSDGGRDRGGELELAPAESAFVDHNTGSVSVWLDAGTQLFVAALPGTVVVTGDTRP